MASSDLLRNHEGEEAQGRLSNDGTKSGGPHRARSLLVVICVLVTSKSVGLMVVVDNKERDRVLTLCHHR